MGNHYHLIVETELERLSAGMKLLNGTHALDFNTRHGRDAISPETASAAGSSATRPAS